MQANKQMQRKEQDKEAGSCSGCFCFLSPVLPFALLCLPMIVPFRSSGFANFDSWSAGQQELGKAFKSLRYSGCQTQRLSWKQTTEAFRCLITNKRKRRRIFDIFIFSVFFFLSFVFTVKRWVWSSHTEGPQSNRTTFLVSTSKVVYARISI